VNIGVFEACIIGLVAALGAVLLKEGVGLVGTWRVRQVAEMGPHILPLIGLAGGLIAGLLVRYAAPETSGSGIPQTKAALAGADVPLGFRTAMVKLLSCIVSLGTGLALGREGPTVQVAAGISARFSTWIRTTPLHRTQLIAAGAGAGLAAAFNAPLAGALFVLEVLLQKMSGLAVGTTVVACFVAAVVSRLVGVQSLDIDFNDLAPKATFIYYDIPFYILLGIVAGAFGALFNRTQIIGMRLTRDIIKLPLPISCAIAGLLTGCALAMLPSFFANYAGLREHLVRGSADVHVAVVALANQFALTTLALSSGVPGGIFAPSLTMGACIGHLVAAAEHYLIGTTNVATFSIVGMGAVFCAVARSPMTAVVIIFEMTTDFNVVLPLMVSCVIAYLVAERLDPGSMYDHILRMQGIILKDDESPHGLIGRLKASDVMEKNIDKIALTDTLQEITKKIEAAKRRELPVIDNNGKITGICSITDLETAKRRNHDEKTPARKIMTAKPLTVRSDETLATVIVLLERYRLRCLPVVERGKCVGMITEHDVVKAESKALGMKRRATSGSYIVYQTRSPSAGVGRMLVAVADPSAAGSLIRVGARIAKIKQYELECLNVIIIPQEQDPTEAKVSPSIGRKISEEAEQVGNEFKIPVHTNISVAHDIGDAIAETIHDRKIELFLMRWSGSRRNQKGDNLLRSVLDSTTCAVTLINRLDKQEDQKRLLMPIADFLDTKASMDLLPVVLNDREDATLTLLAVSKNGNSQEIDQEVEKLKVVIQNNFHVNVEIASMEGNSSTRLLAEVGKTDMCDVLILGLTRKSLSRSIQHRSFKKMISTGDMAVVIACGNADGG
ncbi:MAG: chloride channel protein, partial [Candidatus Obscuribacterales bacterium]|nr:chloride channel protein [Candidatus Obscuribacterales bacterium]